ncbi:MAG: glycosyltransferase [Acidimicrobiia bacterium]
MSEAQPKVSVVTVNYRRPDDTIACIEGLRELDWPADQLEIIVVDNASGDESVDRLRAAAPGVQLLALHENTGFAGGCNRGAAAATGDYIAFINNDARPDPQWLRAAVGVLERLSSVACVACKVLDWDGNLTDFTDGGAAFYGHGFKLNVGVPDPGDADTPHDVLFPHGAAMVIDATVFRDVGGFDDTYFMFFEDVDLGWRLWLFGYEVRYVPSSVVFHRHHASMSEVALWRENYLLERNALFTIYKNYDDENLRTLLPPSLALAIRRGVALGGDDPHSLDLQRSALDDDERQPAHKAMLASAFAVDAFVEHLPRLQKERRAVQSLRRRSDADILRLFRLPLHANIAHPYFVAGFNAAVDAFGVDDVFHRGRRILVASNDTISPTMAGPAIRAWQIAQALSREHDVELVSTTACSGMSHPDFRVRYVAAAELRRLIDWCDVIIFQGFLMSQHPAIARTDKVVVVDIYDPFHLEQLEQARDLGADKRRKEVHAATGVLNQQLERGDFFTCASDKQRDFWLGQLAALGRINPATYDADEGLHQLISVVPFGISEVPPRHTRPALKGVVPGIGLDDKVVLWGGGVYNWFDPLTLLYAIDKLRARVPEVRLYFLGMHHPNPHVPEMSMAVETRRLADELGLTGTHVFFNEGWVEYEDRENYLLEADVGVSTHLDHVETEFSFRTRILDYFWASVPVVATDGDSLAELIARHDLGVTVPPQDVDALEAALYSLLADAERNAQCRRNIAGVKDDFRWSKVLSPLLDFCRAPVRAPDLLDPAMTEMIGRVDVPRAGLVGRDTFARLTEHLRRGEWREIVKKLRDRMRALLQ